jgi:hypothetical protein
VARALLDLERAALSAGLETLQRRALVDVRVAHVQVLLVQELAVLVRLHAGVGDLTVELATPEVADASTGSATAAKKKASK